MPPPARCGPWSDGPDPLSGSTATSVAEAHGIDLRIEAPHEGLSVSAPHWATPPLPLGHDEPAWG